MSKKIAFVGIGQMGHPMAVNLSRKGLPVVGFDRSEDACRALARDGVEVAASIEEALSGADCIVTMLPEGRIVQAVLLSNDVYRLADAGALLIEMSSSAPTQTLELAGKVAGHLRVVDAPVSGGVKRAVEGTLTVMAGGEADAVREAGVVLEALAQRVFHCGGVGTGHAMKAINNYVSGAGVIAAAEAVRLGNAFGLASETIVDVLNASSGRNNATEVKFKQFILSGTFASGFALGLMAKDIAIAKGLSGELGLDLPNLDATSAAWTEAARELGGGLDHTRIFERIGRGASAAAASEPQDKG